MTFQYTDYVTLRHAATVLDAAAQDLDSRGLVGADLLRTRARNLRETALQNCGATRYYDIFNDIIYTRVELALEALRGGNPIIPIPDDFVVEDR